MRGRRPVGPEYADQLAGSDTAKLRTKVILETMMGRLRLKEACERLDICEQRFHQLREEMMTAALQALEPGQAGRPAHTPTPAGQQVAALQQLLQDKEVELRAAKAREEVALIMPETPEMVRKEIWAHLLAYNLIRKVMAQAAKQFELTPWRISFKATLQTLSAFALPLLTCAKSQLAQLIDEMLLAIARHDVGNRPDRIEPRAVKRRPKPYSLLTKPRAIARKLEIQNGCA